MILGIDPGLDGALFFLEVGCGEAFDMPTHKLATRREIDIQGLLTLLSGPIDCAFVELASARPKQGVASSFQFGKGYGLILGLLAARSVPTNRIPAAVWKKALSVPKAKDGARARASELLPACASQWPLARHHGRAEAALLAFYGERQWNGGANARSNR
jgi:crossover junction endodeoxyribonuclease RuvC